MGYTHYWRTGKRKPGEKNYNLFMKECRELVAASDVPLVKSCEAVSIMFNGVEDEGHEDCYFPSSPDQLDEFQFCKTAQKPYDIVVTAALCILQERCGKLVEVSSDGNAEEWEAGRALAEKVLGRPIKVPAGVETAEQEKVRYEARQAEYKRKLTSN